MCLSAILTSCREFKTQAARFLVMQGKFCHIIPVLHQLRWVPVSFRINFKILLLTFKAIHELAPSYINNLVKIKPLNSRYRLQSNDRILLSYPNFKTLTTLGDRAFVASAPKRLERFYLWKLEWPNLLTLLKNFKDRLFSKAFHSYLGLLNTYTRLCNFIYF